MYKLLEEVLSMQSQSVIKAKFRFRREIAPKDRAEVNERMSAKNLQKYFGKKNRFRIFRAYLFWNDSSSEEDIFVKYPLFKTKAMGFYLQFKSEKWENRFSLDKLDRYVLTGEKD